jgi:DHA1 family tetracycline resistance protein-like MFS transporter
MTFHNRAVPIVLAAVLIDTIGFGIVIPVLPQLVVQLTGMGLPEATRIGGYLLIAYALAQLVAGPVLGSLSDAIGRRRVILLGMAAFAIDYTLMAFAPTIGWLVLGRVIAGATGAIYGPANAVLADVTPPEKRAATFGLMGAAFGAGFILGPALGGLLAEFGPRAPFLAAAALALVNAVWIAAMLPETLAPENRRRFEWRRANPIGAFAPLRHVGGALTLVAALFFWQLAHMVYPATWSFWAAMRLGWDARAIGISLAVAGVVMIFAQLVLAKRVVGRLGEARTIVVGMLVAATVEAGHVLVTAGWQVYALSVAGVLQWLVNPSLSALLSRSVDARNQGALQGGLSGVSGIAQIVGPLAMTQALAAGAERGFIGANFALAAGLTLLSLLMVFLGSRTSRSAVAAA